MFEEMRRRLLNGAVYAAEGAAGAAADPADKVTTEAGKEAPKTEAKDGKDVPAAGADDGPPEDKEPAWVVARRNAAFAKERTARTKLEKDNQTLAARLEALEKAPKTEQQPAKLDALLDEAEVERRAEVKAQAKALEMSFTQRSNELYQAGVKQYKDFPAAMNRFTTVGGLQALENDFAFMTQVLDTDDPNKVLYTLSRDMDDLGRILDIPSPGKRLIELNKIANKRTQKQSEGADPPNPVDGAGSAKPDALVDQLDTATWMARRKEAVKAGGRSRLVR